MVFPKLVTYSLLFVCCFCTGYNSTSLYNRCCVYNLNLIAVIVFVIHGTMESSPNLLVAPPTLYFIQSWVDVYCNYLCDFEVKEIDL